MRIPLTKANKGDQVFDFYDDFNDGNYNDKWEPGCMGQDSGRCSGEVKEEGGHLKLRSSSSSNVYNIFMKQDLMQNFRLSQDPNKADHIWEFRVNWNSQRHGYSGINSYGINGYYSSIYSVAPYVDDGHHCSDGQLAWWEGPEDEYPCTSTTSNWNEWHIIGITNKRNPGPEIFFDGNKVAQANWNNPPSNDNPNGKGLGFHFRSWRSTFAYYDWARVRKYADQEPTVSIE
jgi:hypothetical protein